MHNSVHRCGTGTLGLPGCIYWLAIGGFLGGPATLLAQSTTAVEELVAKTVAHEEVEAEHRGLYRYVSKERSDRTQGQLWTEKVIETAEGKLRLLIAENGHPLSPDRMAIEHKKLSAILADPALFLRQQQTRRTDEQRAKEMLDLLPKAFIFSNAQQEGTFTKIDFKPNPAYTPQSMEEKVLHAMDGSMVIDTSSARLHELHGKLSQDVTFGFGLLATIRAGSSFSTVRNPVVGNEWKTAVIDTDINGRAIFFKSIGKQQHAEHSDFQQVRPAVSLSQAVALLEQ